MKSEVTVKQEHILEAAIKRFSHFGIQKTTLSEVADDLSMTKQALLYYFPDKQALITAVEDKIRTEYMETLQKQFTGSGSIETILLKLIDTKHRFFEKYFMLVSQLGITENQSSNNSLLEVKQRLVEQEQQLLAELFLKGMEKGELKTINASKTAGLIMDTLAAFAQCVIDKKGLPEPKDFQETLKKQKEVIHLFYNGLKQ
jgi:TetR/AcrR family transcriptional regulator